MGKKIVFRNSINTRILAMLIILLSIAAIFVGMANRDNVRRIYEAAFTERVLLTNALIASFIQSGDVEYYVNLLKNQDDEFKRAQIRFYYDRMELFRLQDEGGSEAEQQAVLGRLDAFHERMDAFKDESYWEKAEELRRLKEISRSAYVYIMADTGLVSDEGDTLFTFIFDAEDYGVYDSPDMDGLGTCNRGEPILRELYVTKKQMDKVEYYLGDYGELYFAYAPILDDGGEVVAILGTDIALGNMYEEIANSTFLINSVYVAFGAIIILFIYFFLRRTVIAPLGELTETARELAEGNIYAPVPESALKQRHEIGVLAQAVSEMSIVYQDMIKSTEELFDAANIGKIDVRNDASKFKGDIQNVMTQINDTLDATTLYLNSVPESIFIMSKEFEVFFRNELFANTFGDMPASEFMSHVFPQVRKGEKGLDEQLSETLGQKNYTATAWIKEQCFSVILKEIDLNEKIENSVLVIAINITDLIREKENAQAAAEAKSNFLSRMSHEMRTPMNAIIGMTKIADDTEDVFRLKSCLETIGTSSAQLLGIINDVLDMSKIEAGKLELENAPVNIERTLTDVCNIVKDNMEKKNQILEVVLDEGLAQAYIADSLRLSQVITNLLSNAVKFTPERGKITLSVEKAGHAGNADTLRFSVADTGIGITEEQAGRLFNAFEQADGSVSRKYGGTGLGLAISKNIVEKMGGRIWVESEPGAGSTFIFEVKFDLAPCPDGNDEKAFAPGKAGRTEETPDLSGIRLLLAEDVEINREIFMTLLGATHVFIDTAENGQIALSKYCENPNKYDLIVMDIQMPEMDGYQATRAIRASGMQNAKTIPIIAMTANVFKEDVDRCLECGMTDHLPKPIDEKHVIEKIIQYTGGAR